MRAKYLVLLCLPLSPLAAAKDFHFAYSVEDLVSPASFYSRLDDAVSEHCRDANDIRDLRGQQGCESNLMKLVVEQIDHPKLTAYVQASRSDGRS